MKDHQNKEYLQAKIDAGYSSADISKELKVSWKLIEIYLRKFDIPHVSKTEQ